MRGKDMGLRQRNRGVVVRRMRRGSRCLNVHCWNCGNDFEAVLDEEVERWKEAVASHLEDMATLYGTTGFILRAEVFRDAASYIRSYRY